MMSLVDFSFWITWCFNKYPSVCLLIGWGVLGCVGVCQCVSFFYVCLYEGAHIVYTMPLCQSVLSSCLSSGNRPTARPITYYLIGLFSFCLSSGNRPTATCTLDNKLNWMHGYRPTPIIVWLPVCIIQKVRFSSILSVRCKAWTIILYFHYESNL